MLAESEGRFSDLRFSADGSKFFLEDLKDGERRILAYNLSTGSPVETELARYDPDEVIALPGDLLTRQDVNGITSTVTSSDGTSVYLRGLGFREQFTPQPFIDRVDITTGATIRIFEGTDNAFDQPKAREFHIC